MIFSHPSVVVQDRSLFMQQAYTALFNGTVLDLPCAARQQVVAEVTQDLLGVIRSLSPPGFEHDRMITDFRDVLLSATRPN